MPFVSSLPTTAIPVGAVALSASVMPPVNAATSEPTAPLGAGASSLTAMARAVSARTGASLAPWFVRIVIVRAVTSVSIPPLAVPPSSTTLKVQVRFPLSAWYWNRPALMSEIEIVVPAVTNAPFNLRSAAPPGTVATITPANALAGVSLGSVNPKSAAV